MKKKIFEVNCVSHEFLHLGHIILGYISDKKIKNNKSLQDICYKDNNCGEVIICFSRITCHGVPFGH
jgi:hypothetical protein